jgi:hypothetical protein
MKVVSITPQGFIDILEFPDDETGDKINELVGGLFDCISLPNLGLDVWVNDEGLLLGLDLNIFAESLWEVEYNTRASIAGTVVITGIADKNGKTQPVPEAFLKDVIIPSMHSPEIHKEVV